MSLPIAGLLLVQLNFGLLPVAQKYVLGVLNPWELLLFRVSGATIIFGLIYLSIRGFLKRKTKAYPMTFSLHKKMLAFSLVGVSLNQFLLILGLTKTGATSAAIIVPAITIFTYLFALLLGKESFDLKKAATLGIGCLGVLILLAGSVQEFLLSANSEQLVGVVFCILSAAAYAFYLVVSKPYTLNIHPIRFSFYLFSYGFLWVLIGLLCAQAYTSITMTHSFLADNLPNILATKALDPSYIATLVAIVFGPTMLAYLLNIWALRYLEASTVSGFICLQTLIGILGAKLWLSESLTLIHILACVCIIASVLLLTMHARPSKRSIEIEASA